MKIKPTDFLILIWHVIIKLNSKYQIIKQIFSALSIIQSDEINKTELQNTNVLNHIRSCENIPSKTLDSEEPLQFSNLFLPNPRDVFSELIKDSEEKDEVFTIFIIFKKLFKTV